MSIVSLTLTSHKKEPIHKYLLMVYINKTNLTYRNNKAMIKLIIFTWRSEWHELLKPVNYK